MANLLHIHVFRRTGQTDVLLGWATRDSSATDALYQWTTNTGWQLLKELPGTNLIYSSVTWRNRVYWVDGKNSMGVYDGTGFCTTPSQAPVLQYLVVYQARLVGGGDARAVPGDVSEANSNRNLIRYSEALDDATWSPNNFIQVDIVGDGQTISGLGVVSVSTSDQGAQQNLAAFHPHATMIHAGVLGSGDVQLNVVSKVRGCPAYHTITNTPYGLMFLSSNISGGSQPTVCLLTPNGGEPTEVGLPISPALTTISSALQPKSCGIFHNNMYKLSVDGTGNDVVNDREWWLDLRPTAFPQENNWYGPHIGDNILQYEIYNGLLIAAQMGTMNVWKVDVEGTFNSMLATGTARTSTMTWPRIRIANMRKGELDAYGVMGQMAASVALTGTVDIDRGTYTLLNTYTAPSSLPSNNPMYALLRPVRFEGHDAKVTLEHSANSDVVVDSVYVRSLQRDKQTEKQRSSTQA